LRLTQYGKCSHVERAVALQERSVTPTAEDELPTVADEPSQEDFDAADEEEPQDGAKAVLFKVLKVVAVLLVVVAVLLYLVVPLSVVTFHWRRPEPGVRTIPLAPEHKSRPKVSVSRGASPPNAGHLPPNPTRIQQHDRESNINEPDSAVQGDKLDCG
jgi:hypothetical protein